MMAANFGHTNVVGEGGREGGRERGREREREREREGGREERKEGGKEGEKGREGGREGEVSDKAWLSPFPSDMMTTYLPVESLVVDHVDQQDNTALHLACLQVCTYMYTMYIIMCCCRERGEEEEGREGGREGGREERRGEERRREGGRSGVGEPLH